MIPQLIDERIDLTVVRGEQVGQSDRLGPHRAGASNLVATPETRCQAAETDRDTSCATLDNEYARNRMTPGGRALT